ncbi:MAG TPA: M28 family peptidase [Virgibacillus sp.]|nr:M28 family peptidase [Virgibacillus sp.]
MARYRVTRFFTAMLVFMLMLGMGTVSTFAAQYEDFDDLPITENVFDGMDMQIDQFKEDGDIRDEATAHILKLHVHAVKHFQEQEKMDKVIKHMENFKHLIDYQKNAEKISEKAHHVFHTYAEYVIGSEENPFDSDNVMEHIEHLSVDIGPREAGSDAEKSGAEYIEEQLSSYGYETTIEEAPRDDRINPQLEITSTDEEVPVSVAGGSPETNDDGIVADVYDAGEGQPDDFTEDAEESIALIKDGDISVSEKAENAADAGAVGVIVYDNEDDYALPFISLDDGESSIPVVGIRKSDGESLLEEMSENELETHLSIETLTDQKSRNVIATKKPKDVEDPEIVYVGSHLDSVPFAPGANDNASGTASLIELARTFKDYDGDKELRFAAFGGEELGFVGSRYHVDNLPQDEIDRTIVQFQMDMVGTSWVPASQLFINTVDGESNLVSESINEAADRSGVNNDILPLHQLSRSDHVPFHEKGVDSALFIWMEPGTPPGGADIEPYYHSPEDKIEHISPERIQLTGDLVQSAISDLIDYQKTDKEADTSYDNAS